MPTPIGHALGAFAAGWGVAGQPPARGPHQRWWSRPALFVVIGVAADLDLAFGVHSAYTHSIGAATIVAALVAGVTRQQRGLMGLAAAAAYLSHVALDLLSQDTSIPLGVMALWPFSTHYFYSGLDLFFATDRRYWLPGFWLRDLRAIAWEILLVAPLAVFTLWIRRGPAIPQDE
ncbi:MAG: metal-dependent hydrolase [Acidobacteria bacterium]|nr:metal-dependent hydrolase [Acidobacteriota bacterium]